MASNGTKALPVTPLLIVEAVVNCFQLTPTDLKSRKKDESTVLARQVAMYLIRQETDCSLKEVGQELGGRSPATVSHAYQKIANSLNDCPPLQRKVFEIMGLTPEQTSERFGHIIDAYEYGAPPHAGMAPGLDRLVMVLAGEENIREVMAFPVSSSGQTSVMDAPSEADPKLLKELHIKTDLPKKE